MLEKGLKYLKGQAELANSMAHDETMSFPTENYWQAYADGYEAAISELEFFINYDDCIGEDEGSF